MSSFPDEASFGVSETKSTELKETRSLTYLGPSFFGLNLTLGKKKRGVVVGEDTVTGSLLVKVH